MIRLIASLAALGLVATPVLAAPAKSTKTVTTKVTPVAKGKAKGHAKIAAKSSKAKAKGHAKIAAKSTKTTAKTTTASTAKKS